MPSIKPRITIYTDTETNRKLAYIAKLENRSSSNYTEYLIKQAIKHYENEHGEIKLDEPTRKDAWNNQMDNIKDRQNKNQGISETLGNAWRNGIDFGSAKK